ncbi:hypothetical protein Tco_1541756 [Tanacetum coccineum]
MFDQYFTPPSIAVSPVQEVAAPRAVVLAESHVSTSIDLDALSTSIPSSIRTRTFVLTVLKMKFGGVLKNKARLVAQVSWQEELPISHLFSKGAVDPTTLHTEVGSRMSMGTINMGLWYSKDTDMSLTTYADADHAGVSGTLDALNQERSVLRVLCSNPVDAVIANRLWLSIQ